MSESQPLPTQKSPLGEPLGQAIEPLDVHPQTLFLCSRHQLFFICCTLLDLYRFSWDQLKAVLIAVPLEHLFLTVAPDTSTSGKYGCLRCNCIKEHSSDKQNRLIKPPKSFDVKGFINSGFRPDGVNPVVPQQAQRHSSPCYILVSDLGHGKVGSKHLLLDPQHLLWGLKTGTPCNPVSSVKRIDAPIQLWSF